MLTLRIRSSGGTRRLTISPDDILSTLSARVSTPSDPRRDHLPAYTDRPRKPRLQIPAEFSDVLEGRDFTLWRHGDPARRHLLAGIDGGKSFTEIGISSVPSREPQRCEAVARP